MRDITGPYDSAFDEILQKENGTHGFLDSVFSYLQRETDFYGPKLTEEGRLDMSQTEERLVVDIFFKYKMIHHDTEVIRRIKKKPALVNGGETTSVIETAGVEEGKVRENGIPDINEDDATEILLRIQRKIRENMVQEESSGGTTTSPKISSVEQVREIGIKEVNGHGIKAPESTHTEINKKGVQEESSGGKTTSPKVGSVEQVREIGVKEVNGKAPESTHTEINKNGIQEESSGGKTTSPKISSVEQVREVGIKEVNGKAPESTHTEIYQNGVQEERSGRKAKSLNTKQTSASGCDEPRAIKESRVQKGCRNDNVVQPKKNESDEKLKEDQMKRQKNPDTYNGNQRDNYAWSQSIGEVDVRVKVPDHVISGRQCHVTIGKNHLLVSVVAASGVGLQHLVDGELSQEVRFKEAMWSLVKAIEKDESGETRETKHLHISMDKFQEHWWTELLVGEPAINLDHIECTRPFDDIQDEEARAKIRKMVFDQKQKQLGKPTSDELQIQEIMKKSCKQENSPFKDGDFDMSKMSICH